MKEMDTSRWLMLLALSIYTLALIAPGPLCVDSICKTGIGEGVAVLLMGWIGLSGSLANKAWLANPLLLLSWAIFYSGSKNKVPGILIAGAAFLASVSLLLMRDSKFTYFSEGGSQMLSGFQAGYWLWVLSTIVTIIAFYYRKQK